MKALSYFCDYFTLSYQDKGLELFKLFKLFNITNQYRLKKNVFKDTCFYIIVYPTLLKSVRAPHK